MAGDTLSTLQYLIKYRYAPAIQKMIDKRVPLLNWFEKVGQDKITGRGDKYIWPVQYGQNQSWRMAGEGGATPTPGSMATQQGEAVMKYGYGTLRVTHRMLEQAKNNPEWMAAQMALQMEDLVNVIQQDVNTQLHLDGSGVLCTINNAAYTSETTKTVDNPGTHYLYKGMPLSSGISYGTTATMTTASDLTITADNANARYVDSVAHRSGTTSFELDTADVVVDNYNIYRHRSTGAGAGQITGLAGIVEDYDLSYAKTSTFRSGVTCTTTLFGLNRGTYDFMNGNVIHNSGTARDLTLDLMDEAALKPTEIGQFGGDVSHILTTIQLRRKYMALCRADKRAVNTLQLDGGWEGLAYSNGSRTIPLVAHPRAYPNQMYFLDKDSFRVLDGGHGFASDDGAVLHRVTNVASYDALYYRYMELVCKMPSRNTVLRDLNQ